MTTVGPETMTIAPSMNAMDQLKPRIRYAATVAPRNVSAPPTQTIRRTILRSASSSLIAVSSSPPWKRITATTRSTTTGNAAPRTESMRNCGAASPRRKPAGSSRINEGIRSRGAMIWLAVASPKMSAAASMICPDDSALMTAIYP